MMPRNAGGHRRFWVDKALLDAKMQTAIERVSALSYTPPMENAR